MTSQQPHRSEPKHLAQPQHLSLPSAPSEPARHSRPMKSRSRVVKPGRLPVSEFAFDRPGAASPFGDDVTLPVPPAQLTYDHPQSIKLPDPPEREHHEL